MLSLVMNIEAMNGLLVVGVVVAVVALGMGKFPYRARWLTIQNDSICGFLSNDLVDDEHGSHKDCGLEKIGRVFQGGVGGVWGHAGGPQQTAYFQLQNTSGSHQGHIRVTSGLH